MYLNYSKNFKKNLFVGGALLMFTAPTTFAGVITINTDTGTINGIGSGGTFNGTTFTTTTTQGGAVRQFRFAGDLNIASGDTVRAIGSRGASFFVGNNANIGSNVYFDFDGSSQTAVAGGGTGGNNGFGSSGSNGGASISGKPGGSGGAGGNAVCTNRFLGVCTTVSNDHGSNGSTASGTTGNSGNTSFGTGFGSSGVQGSNGIGSTSTSGGSGGFGASGVSGISGPAGGTEGRGGLGGAHSTGTPVPILGTVGTGDGQNGGTGGTGSSGRQGNTGITGNNGGSGFGGINTGTGMNISGGGGGGGGGGASGGSGGSGGSSGGSGGGGGGGGSAVGVFEPLDGGTGGRGGTGGSGGRGGRGGDGGDGIDGGAGGGAFEIVANGRVSIGSGTYLDASGGNASGNTFLGRNTGINSGRTGGSAGSSGSNGGSGAGGGVDFEAGDGGRGGNGGRGGTGGIGASGGYGGGAGGGAGGTVKVVGTTITANGVTVDTNGGFGSNGGTSGQAGRLITATNTTLTGVSSTASSRTTAVGTNDDNIFSKGTDTTPFIADLFGGADMFGLLGFGLDANNGFFSSIFNVAPSNAVASVFRMDLGPIGYNDDYLGFDMLFFVNMLGSDVYDPMLGYDPTGNDPTYMEELLTGGYANSAAFGGSGPLMMSSIGGYGVYATLIAGNGIVNASARGTIGVSGATLGNGDFAYLTRVVTVPEPSLIGLIAFGIFFINRKRRSIK